MFQPKSRLGQAANLGAWGRCEARLMPPPRITRKHSTKTGADFHVFLRMAALGEDFARRTGILRVLSLSRRLKSNT